MNLQHYKKCVEDIDLKSLDELKKVINDFKKIIILGNGGSNAISCHMAEDYTKMLGKEAICFGDSARMSCYANDYGWENAYSKFLEHFMDEYTLVILISSSGNSDNILNAAEFCYGKNPMILLTGFSEDNKLKSTYDDAAILNFWVNSHDYGIVECIHELILHSIL